MKNLGGIMTGVVNPIMNALRYIKLRCTAPGLFENTTATPGSDPDSNHPDNKTNHDDVTTPPPSAADDKNDVAGTEDGEEAKKRTATTSKYDRLKGCLSRTKNSEPTEAPTGGMICDGLETQQEYTTRWRSIRIIYFTMFLMSLGFSIILTGVWPYLDKLDPSAGKIFMGYIVGANPFAQMIFSPLVGWWGNRCRTIRVPLICTLLVFTAASGLYSVLELFPVATRKYWMLSARFLVGVSSANIAVCRSYVSASTRLSERTQAVSMISLAQVLGFIVGPALQALVTPLGPVGYVVGEWGGASRSQSRGIGGVDKARLSVDMFTASGWINAVMGVANCLLFLPCVFTERRIAAREAMLVQGLDTEKETWKSIRPDYVSAWSLIVAFFVLVFNFVLLETLGTSLTMDQFAWTKTEALYYMGVLMSVGAVVACATFAAIGPLCRCFEERQVLLWGGFFLMVIGRALYLPWSSDTVRMMPETAAGGALNDSLINNAMTSNYPDYYADSNFTTTVRDYITNSTSDGGDGDVEGPEDYYDGSVLGWGEEREQEQELVGCPRDQEWCLTTPAMTIEQFILGYALTAIGYPIGVTLIQTIFSKVLGPRPQGVWMGLMTGSGCLSRVMGPVFVGYIYTRLGTVWTFGLTTAMMAAAMIGLVLVKNRLVPAGLSSSATTNTSTNHNKNNDIEKSAPTNPIVAPDNDRDQIDDRGKDPTTVVMLDPSPSTMDNSPEEQDKNNSSSEKERITRVQYYNDILSGGASSLNGTDTMTTRASSEDTEQDSESVLLTERRRDGGGVVTMNDSNDTATT